jgi:hypothetical protein
MNLRGEMGGMYWGMEWHALQTTALNGRLCTFYTEPDNVRLRCSKTNLARMI